MRGPHNLGEFVATQVLISISSGESEFYACGKMIAHLLFLGQVLKELGTRVTLRCYSDSSAARGMMGRIGSGRVRHMQTPSL